MNQTLLFNDTTENICFLRLQSHVQALKKITKITINSFFYFISERRGTQKILNCNLTLTQANNSLYSGMLEGHAGRLIHDPYSVFWLREEEFSSKILYCMAPSIRPSLRWSCPVLLTEKQLQRKMFPPPCFTVGMVNFGSCSAFVLQKHGDLCSC